MSRPDRTRLTLDQIEESLDNIATLLDGIDEATFLQDRFKQLAVERCLEIVSEASRRLPDELKANHPDIPWRAIAGIGNVLRHDYDDIQQTIIWQTATVRVAALRATIKQMLESTTSAEDD